MNYRVRKIFQLGDPRLTSARHRGINPSHPLHPQTPYDNHDYPR
jgi:hypothetical protein